MIAANLESNPMIIQYDIVSGTFEESVDKRTQQNPETPAVSHVDWQDCVALQQIEVTTEDAAKNNALPISLSRTDAQSFVENNDK